MIGLLIPSSYTAYPSVYKLKFDPVGDLAPIIQISQGPLLVVVHPSLPVRTARELLAGAARQDLEWSVRDRVCRGGRWGGDGRAREAGRDHRDGRGRRYELFHGA